MGAGAWLCCDSDSCSRRERDGDLKPCPSGVPLGTLQRAGALRLGSRALARSVWAFGRRAGAGAGLGAWWPPTSIVTFLGPRFRDALGQATYLSLVCVEGGARRYMNGRDRLQRGWSFRSWPSTLHPMEMGARFVVRALGVVARAWALGRALSRRRQMASQPGPSGGDTRAELPAPSPVSRPPRAAGRPTLRQGVYREAGPRPPRSVKRSWPSVGKYKYGHGEIRGVPTYVAIAARQMCQGYVFTVKAESDGWVVKTLNTTGKPSRWRDEAYIAADGTVRALPSASPDLARWFPEWI
jgi:hypothetical protein